MDTSYLRDVMNVSADIRGMVDEAIRVHLKAQGMTEPDELCIRLEDVVSAADQLHRAASDQLREAERAEWHAVMHEK